MEVRGFVESVEDGEEILARLRFEDDLPANAGIGALMKSRHGRGDGDLLKLLFLDKLSNFSVQFSDVLDGRFFSFVSQRKFEQKLNFRMFWTVDF